MTQARFSGAPVEAVTTWQDPAVHGVGYAMLPVMVDDVGIPAITAKVLDDHGHRSVEFPPEHGDPFPTRRDVHAQRVAFVLS